MLNGVNEVDWSALEGAYGPCEEAPRILWALADTDEAVAAEGMDEFASSLWHQGTVYPATVAAVPFVVELAGTAGVHRRTDLLYALGAMADPEQADGAASPAVRAAVAGHADALSSLLAHRDAEIREYAAYALAQCGPPAVAAVERRWATERNSRVRSSLLLALATLGRPEIAFDKRLPVATALAYTRTGRRLPADLITPLAGALVSDEPWDSPWTTDREPLAEVLEAADPATSDALTAAMTPAGRPKRFSGTRSRTRTALALQDPFGSSRSAPVRMMPLLKSLINDPESEVRAAAAMSAAWAGTAAAAVSDELTELAHSPIDDRRYSPGQISLATLVRLGGGWREPLMAAWAAGTDPWAVGLFSESGGPRFDTDLFAAARRRLADLVTARRPGNNVIHMLSLFGQWGPAAASAVPDVVAALPVQTQAACNALARIGSAAPEVTSGLHRVRDESEGTDGLRAGHALWRVTGDPEPLVAAAGALLALGRPVHHWELGLIADAGPAAAPLVPTLLPVLGSTADSYPERDSRIGAARIVWRATGDAQQVLPAVEAILRAGDTPARTAAALASDMAAPADRAGAELVPALRVCLRNEYARVDAARALWRHGVDPAELIKPLLSAVADAYAGAEAIETLTAMGATGAVPGLRRFAEQDKRLGGGTDDGVWRDERLRLRLHEAIAALSQEWP